MDMKPQSEPVQGYIDDPGGKIHYLDWGGTGRSAHFLHGNGFCAGTYTPFIRYLADDLRVVASDARGHGNSDGPDVKRIRHWKIFADDLKLLADATLSAPIIGMGHSLGAVATAICAAEHPRLFSALVLVDPVFFTRRRLRRIAWMRRLGLEGLLPRVRGARRRRRRFVSKTEALKRFTSGRGIFKTWSQEFVRAYLECGILVKDPQTAVLTCDPELEAQIFASVPLDIWQYVARIRCPVLAIRGGKSDVFTEAAAERLQTFLPDCRVITLPGCGHFPPMEKPAETAAAILEFLSAESVADDPSDHKSIPN